MEVLSISPEQTKDLARRIAQQIKGGSVIALYGDLGSGKTTFVQGFVEALGIESKVLSPTFILMRTYDSANTSESIQRVHHLDLYRITDESEALELGINDLAGDTKSVVLIEWPEVLEKYLTDSCVRIKFEVVDESERKVTINGLQDLH